MLKIIRRLKRKILVTWWKLKNKNKDFTIISQNCVGGLIYNNFNLPFLTPTINLFIEGEDFVKLVENLKYYMSIKPEAINDEYIDPIDSNVRFPKIRIDDIEISCMHYKNCNEAIEAWERRKKRINYEKIYVIGNSWNLKDRIDLIDRLCNTAYPTVIFKTMDIEYENKKCINLIGDFWKRDKRGIVRPNLTDFKCGSIKRYFEDIFDFVSWLNK